MTLTTPGPTAPAVASRRGRRRPSALTLTALLLVLAGLGFLGWVGYQYVGSTWVAQRTFAQETAGLRDQWAAVAANPSRQARAAHPAAEPDGAVQGQVLGLLRIPALGPAYEVPILVGTDPKTLSRGVGHYTATAVPGQAGNVALAGHRVTRGQPFARLLELDRGDEVVIETRTATYTYVLDRAPRELTVPASEGWVLDPVPGQPKAAPTQRLLTLTTCQDLFRSPDRSVGFGHLVRTTQKG